MIFSAKTPSMFSKRFLFQEKSGVKIGKISPELAATDNVKKSNKKYTDNFEPPNSDDEDIIDHTQSAEFKPMHAKVCNRHLVSCAYIKATSGESKDKSTFDYKAICFTSKYKEAGAVKTFSMKVSFHALKSLKTYL